jgi:hypothetical protein
VFSRFRFELLISSVFGSNIDPKVPIVSYSTFAEGSDSFSKVHIINSEEFDNIKTLVHPFVTWLAHYSSFLKALLPVIRMSNTPKSRGTTVTVCRFSTVHLHVLLNTAKIFHHFPVFVLIHSRKRVVSLLFCFHRRPSSANKGPDSEDSGSVRNKIVNKRSKDYSHHCFSS